MRRLVTIRTVSEIRPIEGADNIELAIIDGWQCVVKKGEFAVGDKGVYFEIDSFLPSTDDRFKFLEKNFVHWKSHYGARIRTIRLRGQISQGLLLPLSQFPEIKPSTWNSEKDYSGDLKVLKWEREDPDGKAQQNKATSFGKFMKKLKYTKLNPFILWLERTFPNAFSVSSTRPFPTFIPKTDEERIQNVINKLDRESPEEEYVFTVKLDGSSMTVYYNRGKFGVCSRNWDLKKDPENMFWQTALKYRMDKGLKAHGRNMAIQGELMGPGIQGNREGLLGHDFFVYKIWDIDQQRYLGDLEVAETLGKLDWARTVLKTVPYLSTKHLREFGGIEDFLAFAEGPSLYAKTREGVVATRVDGKKGFKVISNTFLLEKKE